MRPLACKSWRTSGGGLDPENSVPRPEDTMYLRIDSNVSSPYATSSSLEGRSRSVAWCLSKGTPKEFDAPLKLN